MSNGRIQQETSKALRPLARLAVLGAAALLASLLLVPSPGSADPGAPGSPNAAKSALTISEVQRRLDVLNHQAEIASEAYNTVRVQMQQAAAHITSLQADVSRQRTLVATLRREIVGAALSDFTSTGGLSTSASFLLAEHPSEFINALATTAVVEHQQAGLLTQFTQQQNQLGAQQQQAARALAAIAADRKLLAQHKATLEGKVEEAKELIGRLQEKQRLRLLARQRAQAQRAATMISRESSRPSVDTPSPPVDVSSPPTNVSSPPPATVSSPPAPAPAPPASGRAAVAVQTALAQLGDPYVYGAAGPDAFDCSGLTMYAWAAAGVALSHASSVQSGQGVAVSVSALLPGDLVFYYSPVSHVGMYIGNGQVVHAPHPGSVVEIVPLTSMPISWARRVG
ncbi:MAG: C40 family peptidase [Nocardioidaceae bacterium]